MSKKVSLPVMSLAITGILYILGLLLVTLKFFFVPVALFGSPSLTLVDSFLGFLAAFLVIWAITSLVLHPDIDDDNTKMLFIAFGIIIIISVFTSTFGLAISVA